MFRQTLFRQALTGYAQTDIVFRQTLTLDTFRHCVQTDTDDVQTDTDDGQTDTDDGQTDTDDGQTDTDDGHDRH